MKKLAISLLVAVGATFSVFSPVFGVTDEIKIGVLAPRGELKALSNWSEFGAYMSGALGTPVKIIPLPPPRVLNEAKAGNVDFVLSHPSHTLAIEETLHGKPLATLNKDSGPKFGGVIIAKKGSGIARAEDLRGKNVMSLEFKTAAGAYIFQAFHLKQKGIDVHKDMNLKAGKKQDDLVFAVRAGVIDAAFVRTGLLEAMEKEGKIKMDEFVIVDERKDVGFPFVHSTVLYPEWYLTVVTPSGKKVADKAKVAAVQMKPDMPAAKKAKIVGFVEPVPLGDMKAALKSLKITPYDK